MNADLDKENASLKEDLQLARTVLDTVRKQREREIKETQRTIAALSAELEHARLDHSQLTVRLAQQEARTAEVLAASLKSGKSVGDDEDQLRDKINTLQLQSNEYLKQRDQLTNDLARSKLDCEQMHKRVQSMLTQAEARSFSPSLRGNYYSSLDYLCLATKRSKLFGSRFRSCRRATVNCARSLSWCSPATASSSKGMPSSQILTTSASRWSVILFH